MAGSLNVDFGLGKATADLPRPGEIPKVREDDYILRDGAGAVGHTWGRGPMADGSNIDSGLELPVALPPPATIPKLNYIPATLGWVLRGSGSLYSRGEVDNSVKLPGYQVISELQLNIMEEVMIPDCIRNLNTYLRKIGLEIISPSDTHGWVWKHDSVVVKIAEGIWIKAEKGGESWPLQNDGGIKLVEVRSSSHPKDWKDKGDVESGRYSVRFEAVINLDESSKFTVEQLTQLLSPSAVNYRILSDNCWQYGDSSVKNVFNFVVEKSEDEAVKVAVRKKLEELKLVERPMPRDVVLALGDLSAPENIKILEKFRRKLAGTLEGLPPDAHIRSWLYWSIKKFVDCIVPRNALVIEDVADDEESAPSSDTARFRRW
jgi:hypothetical protein